MSGHESANPMVTDVFVKGAVQGWNIAVTSTIPNVLMAFVIIKVLNHSGLLTIFGELFAPIMAIFGLPGEAAAVLLGGWMSMGGGVGVAVSLFDQGLLTGEHVAIVAPSIYLMGSQVQYMGRWRDRHQGLEPLQDHGSPDRHGLRLALRDEADRSRELSSPGARSNKAASAPQGAGAAFFLVRSEQPVPPRTRAILIRTTLWKEGP